MTEEMKKEESTEEILAEAEARSRAAKEPKKKTKKQDAELAEMTAQLDALKSEQAALNDKYLRLAAEYDNYRRRTKEEQDRIWGDATAAALAALFPVIDNLERAAMYTDGENVAKGVAMTLKSVEETLGKLGVTEIEALGKTFDPLYHNAVFHVEDEQYGEGEIVEVLQKGYQKGDKILRYAMVKVAN